MNRRLRIVFLVILIVFINFEQYSYAVEAGEELGVFYDGDARIIVLCREPADQQQLVRVSVTYPYFSAIKTGNVDLTEIIASMSPLLRFDSGPAFSCEKISFQTNISFHETEGEILVLSYPGGTGNCTLEVNTGDGTFLSDFGLADQKCYRSYKVAPHTKINLRAEPSTQAEILRTLNAGDIICPTGDVETYATEEELLFFQQVITPEGDEGWVVMEEGLYLENGYYSW